jgi:branched-chain amino acid transport system substrate-binding protein
MSHSRSLRLALATLLAFLLYSCSPGTDDAIVVGVTGPFRQPRGVSMRAAAELAQEEINRAGGIRGRQLELRFQDDDADPDAAVRIAEAFRADPRVVAVVGHLTSGPTAAAAPIYNGDGHPMAIITPSASAPSLTEDGGRAVFRICPTDLAHGTALARHAWHVLHARTAAILFENDAYGRGVAANFRAEFRVLGGTILREDPYNKHVASFEPYLRLLQRQGGAQVLLIAGTRDGAERILATRDSVGLGGTVLAGDGVIGIETTGRAEGMIVSSIWLPGDPDPATQRFVAAYRAVNGGALPDHRGAGAYDIVHLLAQAIDSVGPDRLRVVEYLEGLGTLTPAYPGVTGAIAFDADGEALERGVAIGVVRGRKLVPVRGEATIVTGE